MSETEAVHVSVRNNSNELQDVSDVTAGIFQGGNEINTTDVQLPVQAISPGKTVSASTQYGSGPGVTGNIAAVEWEPRRHLPGGGQQPMTPARQHQHGREAQMSLLAAAMCREPGRRVARRMGKRAVAAQVAILVMAIVLVMLLAGCSSTTTIVKNQAAPSPAPDPAASVMREITGSSWSTTACRRCPAINGVWTALL
jgi:hypothetical protein